MRSRISEYSVNAVATHGRDRGRQQREPRRGESVDAAGDVVLLDQRAADPGVGPPVRVAPRQQVTVHAVGGEFVGGQVDPSALEVFVDVAQEVGELERLSERGGVRRGLLRGADRARAPEAICSPMTSAEP